MVLEKTGIPAEITGSRCDEQEAPAARAAGSAKEEAMLEVPGPPTASGPAADHPFAFNEASAGRPANCQRPITKLSFSCYRKRHPVTCAALASAVERCCPVLTSVRNSDYPEGAEGNRARTCFGESVACWWQVDA